MIKKLLMIAAFALAPIVAPAQESTPANTVKAFYAWYLTYPRSGRALDDNRIFEFVTKDAVTQVLEFYAGCDGEPYGENYFTKTQDWDAKDWLKSITISTPLYSDNKAVVAIKMGTYDGMKNHLFVVLKKDGATWKIYDVVNAMF